MRSKLKYLAQNVQALEKFALKYPNIREAIGSKGSYNFRAICHLQQCGFVCARCGGTVTSRNLEFCNYEAHTVCFKDSMK